MLQQDYAATHPFYQKSPEIAIFGLIMIVHSISSMCVQLFTAFEEAILKFCESPRNKDGRHFHGNEARGKNDSVFSPYFLNTDHKKNSLYI